MPIDIGILIFGLILKANPLFASVYTSVLYSLGTYFISKFWTLDAKFFTISMYEASLLFFFLLYRFH